LALFAVTFAVAGAGGARGPVERRRTAAATMATTAAMKISVSILDMRHMLRLYVDDPPAGFLPPAPPVANDAAAARSVIGAIISNEAAIPLLTLLTFRPCERMHESSKSWVVWVSLGRLS
jgi:hypothetical protein